MAAALGSLVIDVIYANAYWLGPLLIGSATAIIANMLAPSISNIINNYIWNSIGESIEELYYDANTYTSIGFASFSEWYHAFAPWINAEVDIFSGEITQLFNAGNSYRQEWQSDIASAVSQLRSSLERDLDSDVAKINGDLSTLKENIQAVQQGLTNTIDTDVNKIEADIQSKISSLNTLLNTDISKVESDLASDVATLSNTINRDVNSIDSAISNVYVTLLQKITSLTSYVNTIYTQLTASIAAAISTSEEFAVEYFNTQFLSKLVTTLLNQSLVPFLSWLFMHILEWTLFES